MGIGRVGPRIVRLEVSGHAGFASVGSDVVCAGVSALVLSAAQGIASICGSRLRVYDDPNGTYILEVPRGGNACAQAVLATAVSGLRAIARSYPGYIIVRQRRS